MIPPWGEGAAATKTAMVAAVKRATLENILIDWVDKESVLSECVGSSEVQERIRNWLFE